MDGDGDGADDPRYALEVSLQVSTLALSGVGCRDVYSHLPIRNRVPQAIARCRPSLLWPRLPLEPSKMCVLGLPPFRCGCFMFLGLVNLAGLFTVFLLCIPSESFFSRLSPR